jgi:phosphoglycolate phosphatase
MDMETARGVGMIPVGATWGFRDTGELRRAGAERLISHPLDLLHLINR